MSSSSVPIILTSIATFRLINTSTLDLITDSYFNLNLLDQISILTILLTIVYTAINVATFIGPGEDDDHHDHTPPPQYPLKKIAAAKTERDKFLTLFPTLRDSIALHMAETREMPPEAVQWVTDMMDYTCPGGKLNRGTTVLSVVRTFAAPRELTPLEECRACVLGWAIEYLQAFFLVADDLMDDSKTRRGSPCWYLLPKVGKIAVNDSFLLESYVFTFIKQHFKEDPYYTDLLELFLEVTQQTECGQLLDLTSQPADSEEVDLSRFTIERYKLIVKYKTAFYSFYLPVAIGLILSGVTDEDSFKVARHICCVMGEYFQIQDDVLDCYGAPEVIGKVGTDIQENKCSWLVVQALKMASPSQLETLKENYGQWDDDKVAIVKGLYKDMKLKELFDKYEEESYAEIQEELKKVTNIPHDVFTLFLNKIYKRSK